MKENKKQAPRVFLVDNNPFRRFFARAILEVGGCKVVRLANNLGEALTAVDSGVMRQRNISAVVMSSLKNTDNGLPGSEQLIEKIQEKDLPVRTVIYSKRASRICSQADAVIEQWKILQLPLVVRRH